MNTSTTSTPNIVNILSELSLAPVDVLPEFREFYTISLPLAYLYKFGYIDNLNEKAVADLHNTFAILLRDGNLEDVGYTSLNEILELYNSEEEDEDYVE